MENLIDLINNVVDATYKTFSETREHSTKYVLCLDYQNTYNVFRKVLKKKDKENYKKNEKRLLEALKYEHSYFLK